MCPNENCKAPYKVPVEFAGKTAPCKKCGKRIQVPRPKSGEEITPNEPITLNTNESKEAENEPITLFHVLGFMIGCSIWLAVFFSLILFVGWTYYHYGLLCALVPTAIYILLCVSTGTQAFLIAGIPPLALRIFVFVFCMPSLPTVDQEQFYGEWTYYSENYRDENWDQRERIVVEIIPKWADKTNFPACEMVETRITELSSSRPPYIQELKIKSHYLWHIEGNEIKFKRNEVYTTENGTPFMETSDNIDGSAYVKFHGFDSNNYLHYTANGGDELELIRGVNPYGRKETRAGWLW